GADAFADERTPAARLHALEPDLHAGHRREENGEGEHQGASAPTTASATADRTWRIAVLSLVGWARLVSRITKSRRSGSIHIDVPVKPVCPNELGDSRLPADE